MLAPLTDSSAEPSVFSWHALQNGSNLYETMLAAMYVPKPETQEIIRHYASVFCNHFRQSSLKDELGGMDALMGQLEFYAASSAYPSICAMQMEFDLQSYRYLRNSPRHLVSIHKEFKKFTFVQDYWFPKCATLPTQSERIAFVKAVLERITQKDFDQAVFIAEYEYFYCRGFHQGADEVLKRGGLYWPNDI